MAKSAMSRRWRQRRWAAVIG